MADTAWEEVDSINAIFCSDGEFQLQSPRDHGRQDKPAFTLRLETDGGIQFGADFQITDNYPNSLPNFRIKCDSIDRIAMSRLRKDVLDKMQELAGGPMLMDVIIFLKENIVNYVSVSSSAKDAVSEPTKSRAPLEVALLKLDHMRDKKKYLKTITKWTGDLDLRGCVVFEGKLIFIILQGSADDIREFITRLRTQNVDVDSKGRSCKERLLDVLARESLSEKFVLDDFSVKDCSSLVEVETIFNNCGIGHLFDSHLKC